MGDEVWTLTSHRDIPGRTCASQHVPGVQNPSTYVTPSPGTRLVWSVSTRSASGLTSGFMFLRTTVLLTIMDKVEDPPEPGLQVCIDTSPPY